MKKLIILMGNIGAGKTTISKALVKKGFVYSGIDYFYTKAKRDLKIKEWYTDEKYCNQAYSLMLDAVKNNIIKKNVIVESTGASKHAINMFKKINQIPDIKIYRFLIKVPIRVLKERIKIRNASSWKVKNTMSQLPITAKLIKELKPEIDFTINGDQDTNKIISKIIKIVNN
jgi:cytidylate kinase